MKLTAELMPEVRALAMRAASGQPSESSTSSSESQELKAQVSRFNGNGRQDYEDSRQFWESSMSYLDGTHLNHLNRVLNCRPRGCITPPV